MNKNKGISDWLLFLFYLFFAFLLSTRSGILFHKVPPSKHWACGLVWIPPFSAQCISLICKDEEERESLRSSPFARRNFLSRIKCEKWVGFSRSWESSACHSVNRGEVEEVNFKLDTQKRHDLLPRMSKKEVPKTIKVDALGLGMQLLMILSELHLKALSESPHESTSKACWTADPMWITCPTFLFIDCFCPIICESNGCARLLTLTRKVSLLSLSWASKILFRTLWECMGIGLLIRECKWESRRALSK